MKFISFTRTGLLTRMILAAVIFLTACKKEQIPGSGGNPPNPNSTLSISGIHPATGPSNTAVTISGTGFDSNIANDSVYINGVAAVIYSANDSELKVRVQRYTGTGDVVVKVSGVEKTGPLFTYIYTGGYYIYAGAGNSDPFTGSYKDGPAKTAGFFLPAGLAIDKAGNLYVYDLGNNKIRAITQPDTNGVSQVTTLYDLGLPRGEVLANENEIIAGLGYSGGVFFTGYSSLMVPFPIGTTGEWIPPPNDGVGGETLFPVSNWSPEGVAMDAAGNIYAGSNNNVVIIYKSGPVAWTFIGDNQGGDQDGSWVLNLEDQPVPSAEPAFHGAAGVAVDSSGNIFVADAGNNKIRKITPSGVVSTFAGSGSQVESDGPGLQAGISTPLFITIDGKGNLYFVDRSTTLGESLRMVSPKGVVSTLCTDCLGETAGIVVDAAGVNVYATDYIAGVIRQIFFF